MKKLIFLLFATSTLLLSACEIYIVDPAIDPRSQITGSYSVEEYSTTFRNYHNYSISIYNRTSVSDQVWIDNFYDAGIRVKAVVSYETITIPLQTVNGYQIQGSGYRTGSTIQFTYSVKDTYYNTPPDFCNSTAY